MKILSGLRNLSVSALLLAIATGGVGLLIYLKGAPSPMPFAKLELQTVLNLLGGLFVVALMTERAIEVIVSVLRDAEAQEKVGAIKAITSSVADAKAKSPQVQADIDALTGQLEVKQKDLDSYRIDTKETTYCISFTLGVALALVGVRGIHGLLANAPSSGWFSLVDIVVTGAVIAGGSDGIHQMVTAVLDFFNMLSSQSAKKAAS